MYENIREQIDRVIKNNTPEAVLFSGGVDSSAILYNAHKYNRNVMGITVGVEGKESSDIEYSKIVARELGVENHKIFYVEPEKVKNMVETSVKILKSFNPQWISSTTTLLLGTMYAKNEGLKSISSGEGADDLFGSFPFFKNWQGDYDSLDSAIKNRLSEIVVMSDVIAQNMGMKYIAPFHETSVKQEILSIPIEERMKEEESIKTKYPLRKAYEGVLPQICITRPQTMAFTGSGIYDTIRSIGYDISDEEYLEACEKMFKFKSKFEYALFKMYNKHFNFEQVENGGCMHCGSGMEHNKINCKICATLQINGKEISFNGEGDDKIEQKEKKSENKESKIEGAEAIVIHDKNIVLGMQVPKRWYKLKNETSAALIKTLGGKIEERDKNSSKNAVIREFLEEVKGIGIEDIKVSERPIFKKQVKLKDLSPFETQAELSMDADFYLLEIPSQKGIKPNDLPALLEIPIDEFIKLKFGKQQKISVLKDYVIKNDNLDLKLPENYAFMIPEEVRYFLEKYKGDVER